MIKIDENRLFEETLKARESSYSPYSNFAVGAAILADNNQFYSGCNVENIAYPNGTCAETGAIAAMINGEGKKIIEILIYANSKELISPCGACCQRIAEFADSDTKVHTPFESLPVVLTVGFNETTGRTPNSSP